jgi:peptidoglycan hydrolase-like protein with peptidoglycan-binding domain
MTRRRFRWLATLATLVALAGAAWLVGVSAQSPEQAAARASEPPASWITAPVELRVLTATVIQRGDVRAEVTSTVGVPVSVVGDPVVTQEPLAAGEAVVDGARVVEVSGRPVFVFEGNVPTYRSLKPGMSGADVAALQAALGRLGLTPDTDGMFGEATKQAVADMYEQAGYEPVPVSATAAAEITAAEQAVRDAEAAVSAADKALQAAASGQHASVIAQAEAARNEAQRALDTALTDVDYQVELARQAYDAAISARDRLAAEPDVDPGQLDSARLEAETAGVHLDDVKRSTQNAVDAARDSLRVADLALLEARQAGDVEQAQTELDAANAGRDFARASLAALVAVNGPTVPQGEVLFVPSLPARVLAARTTLGGLEAPSDATSATDSSALLELAGGGLVVSTAVRPGDAGLIRRGMPADLLDETTGTSYSAKVSQIADEPVTGSDGQLGYPATVTPDAALPDRLSGANLRVTITAASTESAQLVVPLAAVSSGADGTTRVSVVESPNDEPVDVAVDAGLSADGFVVVRALDPSALAAGDLVVVGR